MDATAMVITFFRVLAMACAIFIGVFLAQKQVLYAYRLAVLYFLIKILAFCIKVAPLLDI